MPRDWLGSVSPGGSTEEPTGGRTATGDDDIWGLCGPCQRWFYCADWFDRAAPQPVCPVCATEPVAIRNRAASEDDPAREVVMPAPAGGAADDASGEPRDGPDD